jgi:hypothetical protein
VASHGLYNLDGNLCIEQNPMGLQPAASYFQYCMLMIVLAGLAYVICEGYIDDIIVHGQDDSDSLVN